MAMANLEEIATQLQRHGLAGDTPVAVIQEATRPSQRTLVGSLATIAADVARHGLRAPAIVIVGGVVRLRERLRWFDSMPLFGVRILVTRPAVQAREFAEALLARGAQPIVAPTIAIAPPVDDAPVRKALGELGTFAWIVFSSHNAVEAAFGYLDDAGRDARAFAGVRIAAVGPQTAAALERHGLRADLVPSEFIAQALASDLLAATLPEDDVLQLGPSDGSPAVREKLERGGRRVRNVAAYRTVPQVDTSVVRAIADAQVLTFASASAVRGFAANVGNAARAARGKVVACIGPATARAAHDAGLHVDVTPAAYTAPALVDALEEYMASRR
jgi:uroporphyrinogen III methyltransferase/synthase